MTIETIPEEKRESSMLSKLNRQPCVQGEIYNSADAEGNIIAFRNRLQMAFVLRKYGDMQDHSLMDAWLDKNSAAFHAGFDAVIDPAQGGDPLFFDGYATIGDIPEEKWERLRKEIEMRAS